MRIADIKDSMGTMELFVSDGNIPGNAKAVVLYCHGITVSNSRVYCQTCAKAKCSHTLFIHDVLEEEDERITAMYIDDMCGKKVSPEFVSNMKLAFQLAAGGYKKREKKRASGGYIEPGKKYVFGDVVFFDDLKAYPTEEPTREEMLRRKELTDQALAFWRSEQENKKKPKTAPTPKPPSRFGDLEI